MARGGNRALRLQRSSADATRRFPERGMTGEAVDGAAIADDETIVVAGGGFALSAAGGIERHHPQRQRPGKRTPGCVSSRPTSPDHHTEIIDGPCVAAVAAERAEVDRTGSSGPGKPMTSTCRRVALSDGRVVGAYFFRPTVRPPQADVNHPREYRPHEGVVLPCGCLTAADHEAVVADCMRPTAVPAQRAKIDHASRAGPHESMGDVVLRDAARTHDDASVVDRIGDAESAAKGSQVDHSTQLGPLERVIDLVIGQVAVTNDDAPRVHGGRRAGKTTECGQIEGSTRTRPDHRVIGAVSGQVAVAGDETVVAD